MKSSLVYIRYTWWIWCGCLQCWPGDNPVMDLVTDINTFRPRQNGRHFTDDIFKCIFLDENVWIFIKISLKFVPMVPINNIPALVQIKAWRRPGDNPFSEPMVVSFVTHICVTPPQWVKSVHQGLRLILLTMSSMETLCLSNGVFLRRDIAHAHQCYVLVMLLQKMERNQYLFTKAHV